MLYNEDMRTPPPKLVSLPAADSDEADDLAHASELMFFVYRDFIAEPDALLAPLGLGRAHHRLLHFVARSPGIHIAELLDLLQITKQSLARVLRDMVIGGYIVQHKGQYDKRQRLLYATARGQDLYHQLRQSQHLRLQRARKKVGEAGFRAWKKMMQTMRDNRKS